MFLVLASFFVVVDGGGGGAGSDNTYHSSGGGHSKKNFCVYERVNVTTKLYHHTVPLGDVVTTRLNASSSSLSPRMNP